MPNGGVGVGVGVTDGVGVIVGGGGFSHSVIEIVSMRHPSPEPLTSLPIRQRSTVGEVTFGPRSTLVVIKPPELPVHACRPARGLPQQPLTVPL